MGLPTLTSRILRSVTLRTTPSEPSHAPSFLYPYPTLRRTGPGGRSYHQFCLGPTYFSLSDLVHRRNPRQETSFLSPPLTSFYRSLHVPDEPRSDLWVTSSTGQHRLTDLRPLRLLVVPLGPVTLCVSETSPDSPPHLWSSLCDRRRTGWRTRSKVQETEFYKFL